MTSNENKTFCRSWIQYFEVGIFSYKWHDKYLTRSFIATDLPFYCFSHPTRAFNHATRVFSILTREFERVTHRFELVTHEFEIVTRGFELVTPESRKFELVICDSCFTFPQDLSLWEILSEFLLKIKRQKH